MHYIHVSDFHAIFHLLFRFPVVGTNIFKTQFKGGNGLFDSKFQRLSWLQDGEHYGGKTKCTNALTS